VVFLALRLAQERDEVSTLAVAGFSVADVLLAGGAVELSRTMLGSLTLPPVAADTAGFVAVVTTSHAIDAVLDGRPGDAAAAMDAAAEIAGRFDVDSLAPVPGPTDTGMDRFVFGSGTGARCAGPPWRRENGVALVRDADVSVMPCELVGQYGAGATDRNCRLLL